MRLKSNKRLAILGVYETSIDGQNIRYTLKRSLRAKYARLEFRQDAGLAVVVPRSYDVKRVSDVLVNKRGWITRQLAKLCTIPQMTKKCLAYGDTVSFLGNKVRLTRVAAEDHRDSVVLDEDRLLIACSMSNNGLGLLVENWYRRQAPVVFKRKADELSALLGVQYKRMTIRGQRTRWGSCSRNGTLSFNWKLLMVPEPVIDYVILHEIAHLKEMNHSRKFWSLVAWYCPDYKDHRKWLRVHGLSINAVNDAEAGNDNHG